MNMRIPKYLVDSDPLLANVPQTEGVMEVTNEEWTAEELEDAERQACVNYYCTFCTFMLLMKGSLCLQFAMMIIDFVYLII